MLKNRTKAIQLSALAIAVAGAMGSTQVMAADVDISASVAVSNIYLWRGLDLGNGNAMVSGDLFASSQGFYGGVWTASGDAGLGSEYDLVVGYATEIDDIYLDVNITNYMYPSQDSSDKFGDYSEILLTVGYGPFSFDYIANIADGSYKSSESETAKAAGVSGYQYFAFNASFKKYTVTLGMADYNDYDEDSALTVDGDGVTVSDVGTDYTHLDVSYMYNDNLTFTVSKVLDQDTIELVGSSKEYENRDEDPLFVLSYSLPIE